jgi:Phage protein Gp138 N-terminal domain
MSASIKPIIEPSMVELLRAHGREVSRLINCAVPGRIEKFDATKKTAEVHPLLKRVLPDGSVVSYTPLLDCPVMTIQGGGAYLQMPVTAGDQCLIVFADRNIDAWHQNGAESVPFDGRSHDLSDAIAIVGLDASNSAQVTYPTDEARIIAGSAKVRVKKDGSEASLIQGAGEVSVVGGKVRVKSTASDLLTVLNGLIDVLKAASTVPGGGPLNAGTIAALEAQKAIIGGVLST